MVVRLILGHTGGVLYHHTHLLGIVRSVSLRVHLRALLQGHTQVAFASLCAQFITLTRIEENTG